MEKLKGLDYLTMPMVELTNHSDFVWKAFQNMLSISMMENEEIENLITNIQGRK